MLICIAAIVSLCFFVNSVSKLVHWGDTSKSGVASATYTCNGDGVYWQNQHNQELFRQQNELFEQEQLRQQNDQFMQDSMKFGLDSVTPMDHGGLDMGCGNSFNDFGAGGLFDCGGFFDGGFGGLGL